MNIKTVHAVYFSGTGTTEKVVTTLAKDLAERLGAGYEACCFKPARGPEAGPVLRPGGSGGGGHPGLCQAGCPICCCPTFGI